MYSDDQLFEESIDETLLDDDALDLDDDDKDDLDGFDDEDDIEDLDLPYSDDE